MEFDAVSAVISEMTCGLVIRSIDYDIRHLLLPHSKMKTVSFCFIDVFICVLFSYFDCFG